MPTLNVLTKLFQRHIGGYVFDLSWSFMLYKSTQIVTYIMMFFHEISNNDSTI